MKKILLLLTIVTMTCTLAKAQIGVGQQMTNNNFETWYTEYNSRIAPNGWHSLNSGSGSLVSMARADFISRQSASPGGSGSYCVRVTCKSVWGVAANGSLTSGRFNAGSMTASSPDNCTYTSTSADYRQALTAYPDSVYIWVRTSISNNKNARINIVIHNNNAANSTAIFQDPSPGSAGSSSTGGVVGTTYAVNEGKVVAKATWVNHTSSWTQLKLPFDYATYASNNATPSYVLATLASNNAAGEGKAGDYLEFDDLVFIYNTRLYSLNVNGTPLAGFDPDVTSYNYSQQLSCTSGTPEVTGTCQSSHASTEIIHDATPDEPYTIIRVKHQNQESTVYKDYTINFTYPQTPTIQLNNGGNYTVCADSILSITASGAVSYAWNNGLGAGANVNPPTANTGNTPITNTYSVTGTDANGCTGTATATVTVNPLPNISISGNPTICSGQSTQLTANGGISYVWNNGSHEQGIGNVTTAGTYSVTGTDNNNCQNTASVTVTTHDNPTVTISGYNGAVCPGETVTLTANGADTYSWSNDLGNTASVTPPTSTPGSTTTYTVTGQDENGCSATAQQEVTVKTTPTVNITSTVTSFCSSGSLNLTASCTPNTATMTWTGNVTGSSLTVTEEGTYTVTASLNGCSSSADVTVTEMPSPAAPVVKGDTICGSSTATLSVTNPDGQLTYHWYTSLTATSESGTGATFTTPALSSNTTYYVSAQNATGCHSSRVPVSVLHHSLPTTPTVSPVSVCGESDIDLPTQNNTLTWYSDPDGNTEVAIHQHIASETTFYAAVVDGNGCRSALASMHVTVNPLPQSPSLTSPNPYCSNSNVSVTLTATPAAGCIVKWYNSEMQPVYQGTQTISVNASTTYYATSYSNATQCESTPEAFNIVINAVPAAPMLSSTPRCGAGNSTLTATADDGLTVNWYSADDTYLASGTTYTANLTATTLFKAIAVNSTTNCESSASNVTAVVKPTYTDITVNKTTCGSYTWEGTTYTSSGTYTKTLTSSLGCDSTVTLSLTINYGTESYVTRTICDNELPLTWNGVTFTAAGTQNAVLQSSNGCDSVVSMTVQVNNTSSSTQTLTLCSNETPYSFLGTSITQSGTYTIHTQNSAGCDSIITLTVTVNPTPGNPNVTDKSICGAGNTTLNVSAGQNSTTCRWYDSENATTPLQTGNSYSGNFSGSTTFYVSSYNANTQCEGARLPVTVTVNAVPEEPLVSNSARCGAGIVVLSATYGENATQCRWFTNTSQSNTNVLGTANTYIVSFSNNQNASRTYYVESYNANTGCKSNRVPVVAYEHAVPAAPQVTNAFNCGSLTADLADYVTTSADLFRWYDESDDLIDESASYSTTIDESTSFSVSVYNSSTGCESGKTPLTVTIGSNHAPQNIYDTTCQNTPYQRFDIVQTFTTTGDFNYVINQTSSIGCDSVVTLNIYVKPEVTYSFEDETCETYTWNGTVYDESGDYTQTFTAANDCDSIVTLHLTIHPATSSEWEHDTCTQYTWNDVTYTESGDYIQHFENAHGCDSAVTLHLTIHPSYENEFTATACQQYVWNNVTYEQTGDYTQNLQSVNGCDSIVTMHLTLYDTALVIIHDTICAGSPYSGHDFNETFYQPNDYILTKEGQTVHECDSTTILYLTVLPVFETNVFDTICHNGTYWFNNQELTEANDYPVHLTAANGCDSLVILHLAKHPEHHRDVYAEVCEGESYEGYDFTIPAASVTQDYQHTNPDVNGCDSITVLHLTVHHPVTTELYDTLCFNESYNQNGFNFIATESTTHTLSLHTGFGCDSTVNLHVTVNPTHHVVLNEQVCAGNTYTGYGFDTMFTQAGVYTLYHDDVNVFGCDSVTELRLTVRPVYQQNITRMICENGTYMFGDQALSEAGVYTTNFTSIYGCDSIVTLTLNIGEESRDTIEAHVCFGGSYMQNGFEITNATATQYYERPYTDPNGCPAVTVLHLVVHELNTFDLNATLCLGEAYRTNGFNVTATKVGDTTHTIVIPTMYGCDSTVVLHLTVNPVSTVTLTDEICAGTRYQLNGFDTLFTTNGVYTLVNHDQNTYGCDSTTTMTLTVWPNRQTVIDTTICFNEVYRLNGMTFYEEGTYMDTVETVHGCDSILILHLNIYPESAHSFFDTACVSYTWNNMSYAESGEYIQHFTDVNGCDSVVTLHLTIYPASIGDTIAFACDSFDWYEHTGITQSTDTLTHTFTNVFGCDSVVTLHLTVGHSNTGDTVAFACDSFDWYEHTGITQSTDALTHTFTNSSGCDSVVTLHLTVGHSNTGDTTAFVCDSFDWYEHTGITQSTDALTHTFTNASGCDSVVTLHLTIHSSNDIHIYDTICLGEQYHANGFDTLPEVADTYVILHQTENIFGCDSATTLHLTVNPVSNVSYTAVVCLGDTLQQYGFDTLMTEAGTYTLVHEGVNIHGCDSTTTLTLIVNQTYSTDTTISICESEAPFTWDEDHEQFWETGDFEIAYSTANGCDSVFHLHLTVYPTYSQDTAVTVCNGALPYYFDENHSFNETGSYIIHLETANGCDSTWHLQLTVTPNIELTATETVCESELPYVYDENNTFYTADTYDIIEADSSNCLTITHFTLNVNPTFHHYDTVTVCEETLPYLYGNTLLDSTANYDIHLNTVAGCDSLITVHFTVIPTAHGIDEQHVCIDDFPFFYGDSTFTQEGVYDVTFEREGLCDSIVTLTLHMEQKHLITETDSVCDHALPYLWRDKSLTQTGIYFDSLTTQYGCDSVYQLTLTVNETQLIEENPIVLCEGLSELWRGMTLDTPGTYRDTVESSTTGCYEIHQVTVVVNPTYLFHDTVTICSDDLPYLWHGITLNTSGFREEYNQTENLCDSIYRLTLIVNPSYHLTENISICDYDLPYLWHGQTLTTSGTYNDTLTTVEGCDSIITLTFTVNPSNFTTVSDTICASSLPYLWHGYSFTATGNYYDTVQNMYGCNDVYELQLTVNAVNSITIYDTVCQGDYYTLYGFDTLTSQAGTLYDQLILSNSAGCDSTVTLILQVMPTYLIQTNGETCDNVPYEWRGGEYTVSGDYYDTLVTSYGCDSVLVLHLTVYPTYDIYVDTTIFAHHEFTYDQFVITPADSGVFTYNIQRFTIAGCDSIIHLTLYVAMNDGVEDFTMTPALSFYPNPTAAMLNISGERMQTVEVFSISGKLLSRVTADSPEFTQLDVTHYPSGHYVVKVQLDDGKTVTGKIIVNRR